MSTIDHTYYKRAKCNVCADIAWTTDATASVRCVCRELLIDPNCELECPHPEPTDAEHIAAVKENYGLEPTDIVNLIRA